MGLLGMPGYRVYGTTDLVWLRSFRAYRVYAVSVEYYNQISTYGINGCRSMCVTSSGRD